MIISLKAVVIKRLVTHSKLKRKFLSFTAKYCQQVNRVRVNIGGFITNVDLLIICPLAKVIDNMKFKLAAILTHGLQVILVFLPSLCKVRRSRL